MTENGLPAARDLMQFCLERREKRRREEDAWADREAARLLSEYRVKMRELLVAAVDCGKSAAVFASPARDYAVPRERAVDMLREELVKLGYVVESDGVALRVHWTP